MNAISIAGQVASLPLGTVIGAATACGSGQASPAAPTFPWQLNATNYFGFRFSGDDGLLHCGYGTVIVGATTQLRTVGALYCESVANTAITISAVPEPSSWALMLGGLAVAGAVVRRRLQAAA